MKNRGRSGGRDRVKKNFNDTDWIWLSSVTFLISHCRRGKKSCMLIVVTIKQRNGNPSSWFLMLTAAFERRTTKNGMKTNSEDMQVERVRSLAIGLGFMRFLWLLDETHRITRWTRVNSWSFNFMMWYWRVLTKIEKACFNYIRLGRACASRGILT